MTKILDCCSLILSAQNFTSLGGGGAGGGRGRPPYQFLVTWLRRNYFSLPGEIQSEFLSSARSHRVTTSVGCHKHAETGGRGGGGGRETQEERLGGGGARGGRAARFRRTRRSSGAHHEEQSTDGWRRGGGGGGGRLHLLGCPVPSGPAPLGPPCWSSSFMPEERMRHRRREQRRERHLSLPLLLSVASTSRSSLSLGAIFHHSPPHPPMCLLSSLKHFPLI